MKKNFQHRMGGAVLVMPFGLFVFFISISVKGSAQVDTVYVPPGEGNLNAAIQAVMNAGNLSHTVFKLEPNGYYMLTGTITVPAGEHLTIIAPEPNLV
ncbi:MAG: hypothetical protein ONB05_03190 [candidate division KSB1 bacterium]|nr:hypothetical protein [candidate division KSB1 bacterium]